MTSPAPAFQVRLAETDADIHAAQRLRYDVFVDELGGDGPMVDHASRREIDCFDAISDHLILEDLSQPEGARVVGVYRLLRGDQVVDGKGFYSGAEYNLTPLLDTGRRLLELGRSCVHPAYRGGSAMFKLWQGLAAYIQRHEIDVLFGVASFHGTDVSALAGPLSVLHHRHLAPPELRVTARAPNATPMDLLPLDAVDRAAAVRATPPLIKAYLRLGGVVGQGAWIDRAFNTVDVCLIMDTAKMNEKQAALYAKDRR